MFNRITLIGYVGRSPEVKEYPNGNQYASFSIATTRGYRNKEGEWIDNTTWHNITVNGEATIKYVSRFVDKGALVYLEGMLDVNTTPDKTYVNVVVHGGGGKILVLKPASGANEFVEQQKAQQAHVLDDEVPF